MNIKNIVVILLILFTIISCVPVGEVVPTASSILAFTATATNISTPVVPSASPTPSPVKITSENLDQIIQVERLGNGVVHQALWLPDGKQIYFATTLGISIFDPVTFTQQSFIETGFDVERMAMSKDGALIVLVSGKNLYTFNGSDIRQIDISEWKLNPNDSRFGAVAISPGTKYVALGSRGQVYVWNLIENKSQYVLEGSNGQTNSLDFSPDGNYLVAGGDDGTGGAMKVWNLNTGTVFIIKTDKFPVSGVAFSPDGSLIASGSGGGGDQAVQILDVNNGSNINLFHAGGVRNLTFSTDGKFLVAAGSTEDRTEGVVSVWSISGELKNSKKIGSNTAEVSISPNGQQWIVIDGSSQVYLEYVLNKKTSSLSNFFTKPILLDLDVSSLGDVAATMSDNLFFLQRNAEAVHSINIIPMNGHFFTSSTKFSPDGHMLAIIDTGFLRVLKTIDHSEIYSSENKGYYRASFSPDGKYLATSTYTYGDTSIQLWNTKNWTIVRNWKIPKSGIIRGLVFSPDGKMLATGTDWETGSVVHLWQVSDGSLVQEKEIGFLITHLSYSPDGNWIGLPSRGNFVEIWQVDGLNLKCKLEGASRAVSFSPDSTLIATGANSDVKLWSIDTCANLETLTGHTDVVTNVKFDLNQNILVTGSSDGTVRVWMVK